MKALSILYKDRMIKKLIDKLPSFVEFVSNHHGDDYKVFFSSYKSFLKDRGEYSLSIGAHINYIQEYYKKQLLEDKSISELSFSFIEESDVPAWAQSLSTQEREHLYSLINRTPYLGLFLKQHVQEKDLTELILIFEREKEREIKIRRPFRFAVDSIKHFYHDSMQKHRDALHYVSEDNQVNDAEVISDFIEDARENFYNKNLLEDRCKKFLLKYVHYMNPYIDAEIGSMFYKYGIYRIAAVFYTHVFHRAFSSPNIYWNNGPGIFGCASAIDDIIKFFYHSSKDEQVISDNNRLLIELSFLLSSRVVYWNDRRRYDSLLYDVYGIPIRKQDKIRFFEVRVFLLNTFASVFKNLGCSDKEIASMKYADLNTLHNLTLEEGLVGYNSVYSLRCKEIKDCYFNNEPFKYVVDKGNGICEDLAWKLYGFYLEGKYCLNTEELLKMIPFTNYENIHTSNSCQISEEINKILEYEHEGDKKGYKYKENRNAIRDYLKNKGIRCFYHFTERSVISSIRKEGGILSYRQCLERGIVLPKTHDISKSRDIDAAFSLEDYVRMSFCRYLPKIDERKIDDKDLVLLRISTEVAELEGTLFTDMEATRIEHKHGPSFDDLKKVNIEAIQKPFCSSGDPDYWQYQSEIMVKEMIPIKYILNIDNPENL